MRTQQRARPVDGADGRLHGRPARLCRAGHRRRLVVPGPSVCPGDRGRVRSRGCRGAARHGGCLDARHAVRHQERRQRIGPRQWAADHLHAVGLRDGHDHGQGHPPLAGLLRARLRLEVHERERVRIRDCPRVQRPGHPERHRADHRQLQAPAAELHPRAEPDVQPDLRDAHAAQRSRTSTRPAARTPPAPSG